MKRNPWKWIGPGLVVIAAIVIVALYRWDQKVDMEVVSHMPAAPDVPGVNVYGDEMLTESDVGQSYLRRRKANTKQLNGPAYDLEIRLNDATFFKALAAVEGKDAGDADTRYKAYQARYHFDNTLVFTVEMHAPKGRLLEMRPEGMMAIRLESGETYQPDTWTDSNRSSEVRREAVVTFVRRDGQPVLAPDTKTLEVVWRDPAAQEEWRAVWDLRQNP